MNKRKGYKAVVESGSCSPDYKYWEERRDCGHLHTTYAAAEKCGAKHYGARTNPMTHSWEASADWLGYTVHNESGERAVE